MAVTSSWGRKCTLTVANGKVSGSANHSNFPVLITHNDLPDEILDSDISTAPKSDGGDIRFTSDSAGSNELAFEIVHFTQNSNPAQATAQIWVKIPSLLYNTDTVIYMWWDNSAASAYANTATYGRNAVWSDYEMVSHDAGTTHGDSTGNYTLTETGTVSPTSNHLGVISQGQLFSSGVAEYFSTSISSTVDLGAQNVTMQLWANKNAVSGLWGRALQIHTLSPDETFMLIANPAGGTGWAAASGPATSINGYRQAASDLAWHMVHAISTATAGVPQVNSGDVYVDGSAASNVSETGIGTGTAADEIYIGCRNDNSTAADYEGQMAEVRIRFSELSSDWIATEYNNQVDDGTFWTAGTPENNIEYVYKTPSDTLSLAITETSDVPVVLITNVTPNPFDDKETGIVITGSSFEATQGTGKVEFTPGSEYNAGATTAQTVTAWGAASITITGVLPAAGPNAGYLWVTNNTGDRSQGYPVILHREAAFGLSDSTYYTNQGYISTSRLTVPSGSPPFGQGYIFDTANHYSTVLNEGTGPRYCEYEWCIKALDAAVDDVQYEFRVVQEYEHNVGGSIPFTTYTVYPKFTIQSVILKAGSDALYPRITEARGIGSTSSRTDELFMLLNDQRSFATSQFTRSDSLTLFLDEVYQILVTLSRDDDLKPAVDETIAILVSVARGDDIKPKIDETSEIFKFIQLVASDTLLPKITENSALLFATIISVFDYLQIDMPDFDYTYSQVESLREDNNVNTLFKFPYQMDDYGVVIGDFDTFAGSSFGLGWSYANASEAINQVFPTDTLAVEVVENAAELLNMFARSDEMNPRITESLINLLRSSRVDELSLAVAETTLNLLRLSRTDELFPQILETVTLIVTLTRSDELLPRLDEITSILVTLNRSDDLAPLFIETFSSFGTMNRPETLAPSIDDQSANALTSSRSDELLPKIDSTIDLLSYLSRQDSLAPRLVEGLTNIVSYLNRSDELLPKIDEVFSSFGTMARSDNLILNLEDAVNIAAVLLLSDDLNVTIDDVLDILSFIVSRYRWRDDDGNETGAS